MQAWGALLRGVNVGGAAKLPMADLRAVASDIGWQNPQTYIASGNLVFQAEAGDHATLLRDGLQSRLGLDVPVLVLPHSAYRACLASCPFQPEQGSHLHGFLTFSPPRLDMAVFDALRTTEVIAAAEGVVWLHAPDGIGRSKVAEKMHKIICGAQTTARNLNTLRHLLQMLDDSEAG